MSSIAEERTWELLDATFKPPSRLTLSEWAERYRYFSPESNPEGGRWRNERAPYMVEIMDAITNPRVHTVVMKCCSQSGKTEILLNAVGYYSKEEPSPILVVQPTLGEAQQWSTNRLAPMVRDCPVLTSVYAAPASRDAANTTLLKSFHGGHITIVGANSPAGLAAKPIRILAGDEVDRWAASAGTEGDPVELATTRTRRFWNRKRIFPSSPTFKDASPIDALYNEGDRNQLWLACPACAQLQLLEWEHLVWENGDTSTVRGVCVHCGVASTDVQWHRQLKAAMWVPRAERRGTASYEWNALVVPWVSWADLVDQWLRAQGDPEKLQVFVNTVLAKVFEHGGIVLKASALRERTDHYAHPVPGGVAYLTMGVDVQEDRLEWLVRGWGTGEQSWLIAAGWCDGDPKQPPVWADLEKVRLRRWRHSSGRELGIYACCVDSGYLATEVYNYTGPRWAQRVYATKGDSTGRAPLVPNKPLKRPRGVKAHVVLVGTEQGKLAIYARLKQLEPGPGTYHWPDDGVPEHYWEQLTAERVKRVKRAGRWEVRFELPTHARAEALDMELLALVAWRLARRGPGDVERRLAALAADPKEPEAEPALDPYAALQPTKSARTPLWVKRKRGWIRRW